MIRFNKKLIFVICACLPIIFLCSCKENEKSKIFERLEDPNIKEYLGEDYNLIKEQFFEMYCPNSILDLSILNDDRWNYHETGKVEVKLEDFIINDIFDRNNLNYTIVSFAHKTIGEWWVDNPYNTLVFKSSHGVNDYEYDAGYCYTSIKEPLVIYENNFYLLSEAINLEIIQENGVWNMYYPKYSSCVYSLRNYYGKSYREKNNNF
ncbi:MAG: hypothetical protein IJ656_01485 [Bacilli bacterium]|nr:hypothetical protein [Bacilli bacterium]